MTVEQWQVALRLRQLGTVIAESRERGASPVASFVETDPGTGKPYLKIPVPDPKVVESVVAAVGPLVEMFKSLTQPPRG